MLLKYANDSMPSIAMLRACVAYDSDSGVLIWNRRPIEHFTSARAAAIWNTKYASQPVKKRSRGYVIVCITVDRKEHGCRGHRVAWALTTGAWPDHLVDHVNGVRDDNRWANLRSADDTINQWNKSFCSRNKSGFKGVHRHSQNSNFVAQIKVGAKVTHLGCFETPEAAYSVYRKKELAARGEFARGAT